MHCNTQNERKRQLAVTHNDVAAIFKASFPSTEPAGGPGHEGVRYSNSRSGTHFGAGNAQYLDKFQFPSTEVEALEGEAFNSTQFRVPDGGLATGDFDLAVWDLTGSLSLSDAGVEKVLAANEDAVDMGERSPLLQKARILYVLDAGQKEFEAVSNAAAGEGGPIGFMRAAEDEESGGVAIECYVEQC